MEAKFKMYKNFFKRILDFTLSLIAFIIFELFPGFIINIFGSGNGTEYMEFANYCLRIFLGGII